MNIQPDDNDLRTLEELQARARELESELTGVQTAIAILQSRINDGQAPATGHDVPLAPAWDAPIPVSTPPVPTAYTDDTTDTGNIYLQSLQPHHPLRSKWELGSGLENAVVPEYTAPMPDNSSNVATELRLFGLLPSGVPWEQRIPFSAFAQGNGFIIGRDETSASIVLPDVCISRAHAQLALNEYGLVISDMGSTNGTSVNGIQLSPYDNNRPVQDGDTLTLGYINLQIEFI
jgi:hypothetical protein